MIAGKCVAFRLVVDEYLARQVEHRRIVERTCPQVVLTGRPEEIEQVRAAAFAKRPLRPVRRLIAAYLFFAGEVDRGGLHREHRPARPAATHATVAYVALLADAVGPKPYGTAQASAFCFHILTRLIDSPIRNSLRFPGLAATPGTTIHTDVPRCAPRPSQHLTVAALGRAAPVTPYAGAGPDHETTARRAEDVAGDSRYYRDTSVCESPMSVPLRRFRDPVARAAYEETLSRLEAGEPRQSLLDAAGDARLAASPAERLRGAAAYAAIARDLANNEEAEQACYVFHFSGQAFRSLGMGGNAAFVYEQSADQGEIASRALASRDRARAREIQRFVLRSAGRAVVEYDLAGRPDKATEARLRFHDSERLALDIDDSWRERAWAVWRFAFLYHLSWPRSAAVTLLCCLPWLSGSGRGSLILALLGVLSLGVTAWRRIRP